jgi:hypothetical protein
MNEYWWPRVYPSLRRVGFFENPQEIRASQEFITRLEIDNKEEVQLHLSATCLPRIDRKRLARGTTLY